MSSSLNTRVMRIKRSATRKKSKAERKKSEAKRTSVPKILVANQKYPKTHQLALTGRPTVMVCKVLHQS
jgi:hypothetical protein